MSLLSTPTVRNDGVVFRQTFGTRREIQDERGVLVGCTVGRYGPGIMPTAASSRVTYEQTRSVLINQNKMTVRIRMRTTGPALAANPVLLAKTPSTFLDNQFHIALAAGGGGRPYVAIANAFNDVAQSAVANANLLNATEYVVHWVYDGSLAAANRIAMYAQGIVIAHTISGVIPAVMRAGASPLCLFNWNGGAVAAPPTDVTVYDVCVLDRALSSSECLDDALGRTFS